MLHYAWLGMGLTTEVRAGENRGRHLRHDFVVLEHGSRAPSLHWRVSGLEPPDSGQERTALVVWVAEQNHPAPVQATGGFIPER